LFSLVPSSPTSKFDLSFLLFFIRILIEYFNGHHDDNSHNYQIQINSLSNLAEKLVEQNDVELTHSSNDSSNNEQTLLTSPVSNGERKRSLFNGGSAHNIRTSTSSLQKAPVYAKIIKRK